MNTVVPNLLLDSIYPKDFGRHAGLLVRVIHELAFARTIEAVQTITKTAARVLTGADGATFILRDGDQCFYADEDAIAPLWKGSRFPMEACISGWAMIHREAVILEDIYADPRIPADAYRPTFVQSLAMVPIRSADPVGAIGNYWATTHRTTEEELLLLQALADSVSVALQNVQLHESLARQLKTCEESAEAARKAAAEARRELEERQRAEQALSVSEERLRQVQKMEAVGQLAGGIAHDFNNMLSVILSFTSLLLDGLGEADPMAQDILEIQKAGERAASLTKRLLAFSRQQVLDPRVVDFNKVLLSIAPMLRRLLGSGVSVSLFPGTSLHPVLVDEGQFEQVLVNLALNARDAMPHGGQLTIETSNVFLDGQETPTQVGVSPGKYVCIAVSDNGCGMDRATQARIFEPFFTTKPTGKGTGLGLAMVYGILRQSGGHVWVYSELGKGTTFKLYLPRHQQAPSLVSNSIAPSPARTTGSETILLVEDDDQVRLVTHTILRRNGYNVLVAKNAGEAILICERYRKIKEGTKSKGSTHGLASTPPGDLPGLTRPGPSTACGPRLPPLVPPPRCTEATTPGRGTTSRTGSGPAPLTRPHAKPSLALWSSSLRPDQAPPACRRGAGRRAGACRPAARRTPHPSGVAWPTTPGGAPGITPRTSASRAEPACAATGCCRAAGSRRPRDRVLDQQRVAQRAHVMGAQAAGAVPRRPQLGAQGRRAAPRHRAAGDLAEERLAGHRDERRTGDRDQPFEVAQHRQARRGLAAEEEAHARVEHQPLGGDADLGERGAALGNERRELVEQAVGAGARPAGARRRAARIHHHEAHRIRRLGRRLQRVGVAEAVDVVEPARPQPDHRPHHLALGSVDADLGRAPHQRLDHRRQPADLLVGGDVLGVRVRRLRAEVEHVGPVLEQLFGVRDRRLRVEPAAAVAERIGGDVDDAEQSRGQHGQSYRPKRLRTQDVLLGSRWVALVEVRGAMTSAADGARRSIAGRAMQSRFCSARGGLRSWRSAAP